MAELVVAVVLDDKSNSIAARALDALAPETTYAGHRHGPGDDGGRPF